MTSRPYIALSCLLFVLILLACNAGVDRKNGNETYKCFTFTKRVTLPGDPVYIYDSISGDISGWWDHSFSETPARLYLEAKPGGGFYEIFDESGDGALHATVTYAHRGKLLRFDGPLGLAGQAFHMVTTYSFEPVGTDSTSLAVEIHAAGEIDDNIPGIVEKVWEHFIFERFKPYIEHEASLATLSFYRD